LPVFAASNAWWLLLQVARVLVDFFLPKEGLLQIISCESGAKMAALTTGQKKSQMDSHSDDSVAQQVHRVHAQTFVRTVPTRSLLAMVLFALHAAAFECVEQC
jgi:hypothetical protein